MASSIRVHSDRSNPGYSRCRFLQIGLAGAAALALSRPIGLRAASAPVVADGFRGLKAGIASYSLRKFSFNQTIDMTRELRVRYLTLKDMHLPYV